MQDIPQEQIMKRFQILPEAIKGAIFSEKTSDAISKSCTLRDIPGNKTSLIGQLTTRVLLGYLRPELFAQEIQKETGMEELKAQHVAHDLDMEIFSEVRLELKKLYPPTMQTPTVQSWTAQKLPQSNPPTTGYQPPTKPKYVIAIPERFQTKSFPGIPAKPVPVTKEIPLLNEGISFVDVKPQASSGQAKPEEVEVKQEPVKPAPIAQQTPPPPKASKVNTEKEAPQGKTAQTVEPSGVKITPVVPLPTFIGSRFKAGEDAQKQAPSAGSPQAGGSLQASLGQADASQRIKEAIAKYSSSSTAKPKLPADSPYKEKI